MGAVTGRGFDGEQRLEGAVGIVAQVGQTTGRFDAGSERWLFRGRDDRALREVGEERFVSGGALDRAQRPDVDGFPAASAAAGELLVAFAVALVAGAGAFSGAWRLADVDGGVAISRGLHRSAGLKNAESFAGGFAEHIAFFASSEHGEIGAAAIVAGDLLVGAAVREDEGAVLGAQGFVRTGRRGRGGPSEQDDGRAEDGVGTLGGEEAEAVGGATGEAGDGGGRVDVLAA